MSARKKPASGGHAIPDPLPAYLVIAGDDEQRKDEILTQVRASFGKDADILDIDFDGRGEDMVVRLARDLTTRSLFGGTRVLVLRDGDALVKKAGKALAELPIPLEGNHLILRCVSIDQRFSFFKRVKDSGGLLMCERPKADHLDLDAGNSAGESELLNVIQADARRRDLSLDNATALEIALRLGNDRLAIGNELAKLGMLRGDGRITLADVQALTPQSALLEPFRLFQEVAVGDAGRAMTRVRGLLERGVVDRSGRRIKEPQGIALMLLATLSQKLALLGRYREAQARGLNRDQIQSLIGVKNPGQMYFLAKEVAFPIVAKAGDALIALGVADRAIKRGEDAELALMKLIGRLAILVAQAKQRSTAGSRR